MAEPEKIDADFSTQGESGEGDQQLFDKETPSPMRRRRSLIANKSNALLCVAYAASIVLIYSLGAKPGPSEASAEQIAAEAKVEVAMALLTGPAAKADKKKAREVVESFYLDAAQRQVPISQMTSNPFVFKSPVYHTTTKFDDETAPSVAVEESFSMAQAMDSVKNLHLQSVLTGEQGSMALISNNLLTEGQVIKGWTVTSIDAHRVVLTCQGQQFILHMGR